VKLFAVLTTRAIRASTSGDGTAGMSEHDDTTSSPDPYSRKVGERLRAIRRQKRLSLQEVEAKSNQEFKASVLGAYERGERAISVPRLQRLSRFYSVPVDQLLPVDEGPDFGIVTAPVIDLTDRPSRQQGVPVTIDLTKLEQLRGPEADMLSRYLTMIQVKRQDFNGRVLTIRRDDHQALAAILGTGVDGAGSRLDELGLSFRANV
jgi:transcriptional regulator with XRE-family HTH domain